MSTLPNKCCGTCGFLACNFGKPTLKSSTDKVLEFVGVERMQQDWYTQENLDRLWNEHRQGGKFLICHSTDPNASDYGGEDSRKDGPVIACIGLVILSYMHIKVFEYYGAYGKYVNAVGRKVAMSKQAIGESTISIGMGRADLFGKFLIPKGISEARPISFPTGFEKTIALFEEITGVKWHRTADA